jgi:beta-galactosidase
MQIRHLFTLVFIAFAATNALAQPVDRKSFNQNWKFLLGDEPKAKEMNFNDSNWRSLNLPHDWSIEGSFDEKNPAKTDGGALPTGIGWYRKSFTVPAKLAKKNIAIEFDGVFRNAEVWINGNYLGKRAYGYSSFQYDLTPHLKFGGKNEIAVRVDNSLQPHSRWYTGSGIYRNVWLTTTGNVAVDHWGTFVTTPQVDKNSAAVHLQVDVKNNGCNTSSVKVRSVIYGPDGKSKSKSESSLNLNCNGNQRIEQDFTVENPVLWSPENPKLYKIVTEIYQQNKRVDRYETPFGIRYFKFDSATGFYLNGEPLKLLGVCQHHDLGALGAAFNTRAAERQLEILKAMGTNAIRTAHNPPAPEFLDLCDRMGFLVMDESFDMWKKKKNGQDYHKDFDQWHKVDLEMMVKRDRNHPSIIMWSIGNEIREQFDESGKAIAQDLVKIVKSLDPTRPVTSALTENFPEKNFIYQSGALDVLSFNYKHVDYADLPKRFPGQKFISSETASALQTRGHYDMPSDSMRIWPKDGKTKLTDANPDWTASAYDNAFAYWGSPHETIWKVVKSLPHMAGLFVWSGFDFLGEPHPYPWPARSSYYGIIDLAGFPKDVYYMYQSEWTTKPVLHIFPHWNWQKGQTVDVWAYYSQADEVDLFLNGRSLGTRKKQGDEAHVVWKVPYEPGTLKAVSRKSGKEVLNKEIKTAGSAAKIELIADRKEINADGKDLSFITVRILDADGNLVPKADNLVNFEIAGKGFIAGVDNGYQASMEPFKASYRKAYNGMCLAIIQATDKSGTISLRANSPGLQTSSITIKSK